MASWEKYPEGDGWLHVLPIDNVHAIHVYQAPAGDYAIGVFTSRNTLCSDLDYRNTLVMAKSEAESIVSSGEWQQMVLEGR